MTFEELLDLIEPYSMAGTLEGLGEAKRILHEHADKFSGEEREKIGEISSRLMGEMSDLLPELPDDGEEDDDDIPTIFIPAGRKSDVPVRKS
jgi:hypothetical protein